VKDDLFTFEHLLNPLIGRQVTCNFRLYLKKGRTSV